MRPGTPARPRPLWTSGQIRSTGWLRKYYPPGADEPAYGATPAVETALSWLRSLQPAPFVGTESRLNTVIELLR